jgi:hypothetical protein
LRRAEPEYSEQFLVRSVRKEGDIKLDGEDIYVSGVLSHERIGLLKVEVSDDENA